MSGKRSLRDGVRQAILKEYVAGVPTAEIAERYGVSPSYPTVLAGRSGIALRMDTMLREEMSRRRKRSAGTAVEVAATASVKPVPTAEIRRLSAKGIGVTAIGALLRCSYRDVTAALGG